MQIIACFDCDTPRFTRLPSGETQLRVHFGHTEADIRSAGGGMGESQLDEFIKLWAASDYPRRFSTNGPELLISPA